jgi:hypothetical protein
MSVEAKPMGARSNRRAGSRYSVAGRLGDRAASGIAGLVAGLAYLGAQMSLSTVLGLGGPAASLQRIGAILLGPDAAPPGQTAFVETAMGLLIHLPLSLVLGFLIGALVQGRSAPVAAARGAAVGVGFFVVAFYLVAPSVFPWFLEVRNVGTALDHAMFGALTGWLAIKLQQA